MIKFLHHDLQYLTQGATMHSLSDKSWLTVFACACVAYSVCGGTLTVQFSSAMEVEIDGAVQSFAANATFMPTAIPCIYKMRPVLAEGERTFGIKGSEDIRGGDLLWRFPQYGDGNWVRVALNPYPSSDTTVTLTGYKTSNFYYVDAENGNDDWDGTADYEHRDEANKKGPKKSLQAAHDVATGTRPIVFAAPGVYSTGVATNYNSGTSYPCIRRLISTKANIGYIATEGAENTFIVGAPDTSGDDGRYGAESVSGVYLGGHTAGNVQFMQGFTITGCYSPASQSKVNQYGTAFCSDARRAYCLDCVISNNWAGANSTNNGKYPATSYGVIERTRIVDNKSLSFVSKDGVFISCVFARNRLEMSDSTASNRAQHDGAYTYFCTYDLKNTKYTSGRKRLESDDCRIYAALAYGLTDTTATNATRWLCKSQVIDDPKFVNVSERNYRLASDSPAIDLLSYKDDLNAMCRRLMDFRDVYGSLRALNVNIDLGAAEYDWRPKFAEKIGKGLTLSEASAFVTTNTAGELVMGGSFGENSLSGYFAGTVAEPGSYLFTFEIPGGTLKAFVGGVAAGEYSTAGETKVRLRIPDATTEFRFVFAPDSGAPGLATLRQIAPIRGMIVILR